MRRTRTAIFSGVVGLGLVYAGFAMMTARTAVYPWWYHRTDVGVALPSCSAYMQRVYEFCHDPKVSFNLDFSEFSFGQPSVAVKGWSVPVATGQEPRGTVILVHGGGADRRAMLKHLGYLHASGYHVLLIDCYNHGLNYVDGHGLSFGLIESQNIVSAATWASQNLPGAAAHLIVAMGTSQGAFAALRSMAISPLIKGVVAENPFISVKRLLREFPALSWEPHLVKEGALLLVSKWLGVPLDLLDVHQFVAELGVRPVLLMHGSSDRTISSHQTEEIYDLLKGPKQLWIVPGGEHEYLWNVAKAEYQMRVLKFLETIK